MKATKATSAIRQQCVYACGPYKDYCGRAEYDAEARIFHGEVLGTRDVVTFQGATIEELPGAFAASVDDYLHFCEQLGQRPEKPFSGKFVARMPPELHQRVSALAQAAGKSLNQFVVECLEEKSQQAVTRTAGLSCAVASSHADGIKWKGTCERPS